MIFGNQETYYKYHSAIYDLSRWAFLFGRKNLTNMIPDHIDPEYILDIGCGTGYQLERLSGKYPAAEITGIEPSLHMIDRAKQKPELSSVQFIHSPYEGHDFSSNRFDLIVASYSLTMAAERTLILRKIHDELKTHGLLAVADFYDTSLVPFRKWMGMNHVSFIPGYFDRKIAKTGFQVLTKQTRKAYGGIWSYTNILYRKV